MAGVISLPEFVSSLRRCLVTTKTSVLSVAHSGGPDSSCLLYLLNVWLNTKTHAKPAYSLVSFTIDHQLQSTSARVAQQASDYAVSLGIPSYVLTIPWSIPPYPPRPSEHGPLETIARKARYDILQSEMKKHKSFLLAMGHHADDNVETLLMRMNIKNTQSNERDPIFTTNPIRPRRRIGMSNVDKLLGMEQWIVRPLLPFPKSRILATCERYEIPYTIDQTNFQPSITPRNFIRHYLRKRIDAQKESNIKPPAHSSLTVCSINKSVSILESVAERCEPSSRASSLATRLYLAAGYASKRRDAIDEEVTSYLSEFAVSSPPSTFVIPLLCPPSQTGCIPYHVVRRILRYVSPAPWGHPSAEAFGSSVNLREISRLLWSPDVSSAEKRSFTLGSQVIWRLYKHSNPDGKMIRWIASRQPPILRNNAINPCIVNITHMVTTCQEDSHYIWDNRFLVVIRPTVVPLHIRELLTLYTDGEIYITPYSKWFLPRIELRYTSENGKETVVLEKCDDTLVDPFSLQERSRSHPSESTWIHFSFIRTLETI